MKSFFNRFIICVLLFSVSLLFTSCIDYVQAISYKDGNYHIYYKITLSKVLFALGNEDPEEFFAETFDEQAFNELPESARLKKVNTDLEVGIECGVIIHPKTSNEEEKALLPKAGGNKYYIPFLLGNKGDLSDVMQPDDTGTEDLVQALMASAKCRIMIGKKIIPDIESAYFEGLGGQNYSVPVFDYGDVFCMEIPFSVLFESGMYNFNDLIIIKKL